MPNPRGAGKERTIHAIHKVRRTSLEAVYYERSTANRSRSDSHSPSNVPSQPGLSISSCARSPSASEIPTGFLIPSSSTIAHQWCPLLRVRRNRARCRK